MEITIPEKTQHVCDSCHRDGFLETCHVCGQEFCLTCQGTVAASWGFTTLCRVCSGRDDVEKICERFAKKMTPLFKSRDAALKRLGRRAAAEAGGE